MIIAHISDQHSIIPTIPAEAELILDTGDFLPNKTRGSRHIEPEYQKTWIIQNLDHYVKMIGSRTFLHVGGNHDFMDPCEIFRKAGISAYSITNKKFKFKNITFYGFPYVNWMGGEWNYELTPQNMIDQIDNIVPMLNAGEIDVMACHAPIYGILDKNTYGQHCGNTAMKNAFEYKITNWPILYAHGHIHQEPQITSLQNHNDPNQTMIISNAATICRVITI